MERSFYKNYFTIEKTHWLMIVRRSIALNMIKLYSDKSPQEMKILDFGCGSGYFVSKLRDAEYQAQGLDISAEAIQYGQRQGIQDIDVLDAHRFNFADRCFDCVLSLDVIEHLEDESWALQEFERILKPGGILIMTVPAFTFLWGVQDKAAHHFRRYSMSQLLKKVKSSTRLSILRKSYFNFFLFLPIAAFRLMSRWFNIGNRESDFEINNELVNRVLLKIVDFERLILKYINFPVGVSILLVLRKSDSARGITECIESMANEPRDSGDLKEDAEIHALRP
jgi:2-polyprenyl-3-methyl-5-hydroxy-6-metoxy-1,4-benzoquinol methylase